MRNATQSHHKSFRPTALCTLLKDTFTGRRQGGGAGATAAPRLRRGFELEAIEPRLLLSADLLHSAADGAALNAALRVVDANGASVLRLQDIASEAVLAEHLLDQDIRVTVHGNALNDRLQINFDSAAIAHQVSVDYGGGGGEDTLVAADIDNTWIITGQDAGTLNALTFADVENLTGGAVNDIFVFEGGSINGTIDGG